MAGRVRDKELSSIPAQLLEQFSTYNMTGWFPRSGTNEFGTLTLLQRNDRFFLRITKNRKLLEEIALDNVKSYVIRVRPLATYFVQTDLFRGKGSVMMCC